MRKASLRAGLAVVLTLLSASATAQYLRGGETAAPTQEPSLIQKVLFQVAQMQARLNAELTETIRAAQDGDSLAPALAIIGAAFLYGVLHAAGPGHGKAVVATYFLTHPAHGQGIDALRSRQLLMHRHCQHPPPQRRETGQHHRAAAPDPGQIGLAHRQDVAEQIAHQVDPERLHEADDHQPQRQGGMGEQAEQRVGGEAALFLQQHNHHCEQGADGEDADGQIDRQQDSKRDAEQGGMGQGIAEIGHPPPHHEAAQRACHQGDPDAAEGGANDKIVEKHGGDSGVGCFVICTMPIPSGIAICYNIT